MMQKIRFKDKEYLFLDGVIATEEQYRKGKISYAFLRGKDILRYDKIIGHADEIEYIGEIENVEPNPGAFLNVLDQQSRIFANLPFAAILRKVRNSKGKGGTIKFQRYGEVK